MDEADLILQHYPQQGGILYLQEVPRAVLHNGLREFLVYKLLRTLLALDGELEYSPCQVLDDHPNVQTLKILYPVQFIAADVIPELEVLLLRPEPHPFPEHCPDLNPSQYTVFCFSDHLKVLIISSFPGIVIWYKKLQFSSYTSRYFVRSNRQMILFCAVTSTQIRNNGTSSPTSCHG